MSQPADPRFAKGMALLEALHPKAAPRVLGSLDDIAPDFARFVIEFAYGDVYSRPALTPRERQIGIIAALTATNHAEELEIHIEAGLNAGLTREQITEVIMQMAVYAGFPAALSGLAAARRAFAARDQDQSSSEPS